MKSSLTLILLIAFGSASACEGTDDRDFGAYSGRVGSSANASGQSIAISTSFLERLIKQPTGTELEKNRNELFYLLSINNERAVTAGLKTLVHLLKHPSFSKDCDAEHEMYGKEELAFALSRTEQLLDQLCKLTRADRGAVVKFYASHIELYSNYDPPWAPGNLSCK